MKCKHCGAILEADDAFCRKCGAPLPSDNEVEEDNTSAYPPKYAYDRRPFSGKAIAGFVVSLVGVVTFVLLSSLWLVWLPCAIVGLLLSMYATRETARLYRGNGLAIAGLVMSTFTLVFAGTFLLIWSGHYIITNQIKPRRPLFVQPLSAFRSPTFLYISIENSILN